ncbi:hypothetical protein HELRODRAFT_193552 [Helobdella robusta]|uniref:Uncharacterized protein n=1 Tax=Helobdella robusta TaxID=6412 RepID=T1FV44_HELRO|nr:hypothetical protein HELRODRAFT_193552 [Helobdella robusta]ESN95319.1 hypothetical protein HELRODRAFT_193552 [Helobdella robusta]
MAQLKLSPPNSMNVLLNKMTAITSNSNGKKILNLSSPSWNSPQHKKSNWIIGSPQEECLTDRFGRTYDSDFLFFASLENNVDQQLSKGKTILSHIINKKQASENLENSTSTTGPYDSHTFWTFLFQTYFLNADDQKSKQDDMLFFVKQFTISGFKIPSNDVEVYRSNSSNLPSLLSLDVNWEETVYLNLILHHFQYHVTCAVCTRTGRNELQVLKKFTQVVYPSPSYRGAEVKGTSEEITYPYIYFTIDNYEEAFSDLIMRDSELLCVELVAKDQRDKFKCVLFQGSVKYPDLRKGYDDKRSSQNKSLYHKLSSSFRWLSNNSIPCNSSNKTSMDSPDDDDDGEGVAYQRVEFLKMRGPDGKGITEIGVRRARQVKLDQNGFNYSRFEHEQLFAMQKKKYKPATTSNDQGIGERHSSDPSMNSKYYYYHQHHRKRNFSGGGDNKNVGHSSTLSLGWPQRNRSRSEEDSVDRVGLPEALINGIKLQDELDDNKNSSSIGCLFKTFGQSYFAFKEQRRLNSTALHSFLTHISLPWHRIIADLLEPKERAVISNT